MQFKEFFRKNKKIIVPAGIALLGILLIVSAILGFKYFNDDKKDENTSTSVTPNKTTPEKPQENEKSKEEESKKEEKENASENQPVSGSESGSFSGGGSDTGGSSGASSGSGTGVTTTPSTYLAPPAETKTEPTVAPKPERTALEILKEKFADNGLLTFLTFFEKDQQAKALTKNIHFRKSIYHSLNRKDLEQTNDNYKLSSSPLLFTKAFFNDNHVYFPEKTFSWNEEDAEPYKDDKLENDGFDQEKALNLLQQAWDSLTPEQKQEKYKLNLLVEDKDLNEFLGEEKLKDLTDSILKQIQKLFDTFMNKNNLPENNIKIQTVDKLENKDDASQNMNMRLDIMPEKDEYNEENYYWHNINNVLKNGIGDEKITLNFSPLKTYLNEKKSQGNEIDTKFFSGLASETGHQYDKSYPGVDKQKGLFTSSHKEFLDFYYNVILKLLSRGSNDPKEQKLMQQTYEEIFKKVLALIKEHQFHIPLVNYIATN